MNPIIHIPESLLLSVLCAKLNCPSLASARHHTGCEHMWIEQFRARRSEEKRYQKFCARYWEFRKEDWVPLCRDHHRVIHNLYFITIGATASRLGPCRDWSWIMAEELMAQLRLECARWLRQ